MFFQRTNTEMMGNLELEKLVHEELPLHLEVGTNSLVKKGNER